MDAAGRAGGRVPAGVGREMLGVAQRGRILAMARQRGAGGRGAERQALAQRAGERRIEAKNLIQQSEAGAGEESRLDARVGADGRLFRRPRPERKRLFQQWVGRRETGRGGRRDRRRGKARRRAARSAAGVSSSKEVGGIESDHGLSITQGGALSPISRQIRRACLAKIMSDNVRLSDMIRNAPKI